MDELQGMIGRVVVEAGVRQAWPFLTLLDPSTNVERRLYFDTDMSVASEPEWLDQDDPQTLVALGRLVNLWIEAASIDDAGDLRLSFDGDEVLVVKAAGNAKTTSDSWRLSSG